MLNSILITINGHNVGPSKLKTIVVLSMFAMTLFSSCSNSDDLSPLDSNLAGKWKMVSVQDYQTQTMMTKPPDLSLDIVVTFLFTSSSGGKMNGAMTTGALANGNFSITAGKVIAVPVINLDYPSCMFYGSADWDKQFEITMGLARTYSYNANGNLLIACGSKVMSFERF